MAGKSSSADELVRAVRSRVSASELAELLDGMGVRERVEAVARVTGSLVGQLYELARDGQPLELREVVGDSIPAGATVAYSGRNSLAMFSRFEKRLTRTADGLVFGYNHQPLQVARPVTGPGYFRVVDAGPDHPGELLFDYTQAPPFEPAGWPAYRPNEVGLSRFVFMDLHDYVRRVARGVLVGKAYRRGKDQNAYFSLTALEE